MAKGEEQITATVSLTGWEIAPTEGTPLLLTLSFEDPLGEEGQLLIVLPVEAAGPLGRTLLKVGADVIR